MAARPRVLLVLFEGLAETVIDSAVLDHARVMRREGVADIEIWAFCWSSEIYRKSRARLARARKLSDCELRLFRAVRPGVPFSAWINSRLLSARLHRLAIRPDLIHGRDTYATAVCSLAKPAGPALLWDCRGDWIAQTSERLSAMRNTPDWAKGLKLRLTRRLCRDAAAACDGAIFVSHPLAALWDRELGDKPRAVIPCAASESFFYWDLPLRQRMRAALGYADDERVFIYSGSLAPYQCFDEGVRLFASILAQNRHARLLVVTPEIDAARRQLSAVDPQFFKLVSCEFERTNEYLNAADVALMIRRPTPTNAAASPVKFAEYSLAGLPVVMTDSVTDSWRIAQTLGNRVSIDEARIVLQSFPERGSVAQRARIKLGKHQLADRYGELIRMILGRARLEQGGGCLAQPIA
jgi:hypothetical protein